MDTRIPSGESILKGVPMTARPDSSAIKAAFLTPNRSASLAAFFDTGASEAVRDFHRSVPGYRETPLHELKALARHLGVRSILVKDESSRFGLNSFKALGGTYAIARLICRELGLDFSATRFTDLQALGKSGNLTSFHFITATDGNHGKGVAWAAAQLGCPAHVFLPGGAAAARIAAIRAQGAHTVVTDLNYDGTVRLAAQAAGKNNWFLIQDTALDGYEEIPGWITRGYLTMAFEAAVQMAARGLAPTHLFLQAGVGSMAGAVTGFMAGWYGKERPCIVIVEPDQADCHYRTALADDGRIHAVTGAMETIMAGLACGEPNPLTWEIIRQFARACISCPDTVTRRGMKRLAHPIATDPVIVSGESGAVGIGLAEYLLTRPETADLAEKLGIGSRSVILCFSTEGDTDPASYRTIINS